jgi:uncharacterized protein YneF (UPF0154 family)
MMLDDFVCVLLISVIGGGLLGVLIAYFAHNRFFSKTTAKIPPITQNDLSFRRNDY